jgi:hypothetical protein
MNRQWDRIKKAAKVLRITTDKLRLFLAGEFWLHSESIAQKPSLEQGCQMVDSCLLGLAVEPD